MKPTSPEEQPTIRGPHPLAAALIDRLKAYPGSRVLDFASGSRRNTIALEAAGLRVDAVDDATAASRDPLATAGRDYLAALSTHGFLHGSSSEVVSRTLRVAARLQRGGLLYATFGSTADARFGKGMRIDEATFAAEDGDEAGVPHAYFTRPALQMVFQNALQIQWMDEWKVDDVAGSWAHEKKPLERAAHWFVIALRR